MDSRNAPAQAPIEAALRAVAERQRRELGPHVETDELLDYHAGALPEEAAERVRGHLTLCPECAGRLLDLEAFHGALPEGEADADAEAAWRELAPRLRGGSGEVVPLRRPPTSSDAVWRALAAVLFFGVVGLSTWVILLRRDLREAGAVHPAMVVNLSAEGDETRGAVAAIPRQDSAVILARLPDRTDPDGSFEAEILGPGGAVERKVPGLRANRDPNRVTLELDPGWPKAPGYTLRLYRVREDRRQLVAVYSLPPPQR